jgi:hypothetical protein
MHMEVFLLKYHEWCFRAEFCVDIGENLTLSNESSPGGSWQLHDGPQATRNSGLNQVETGAPKRGE